MNSNTLTKPNSAFLQKSKSEIKHDANIKDKKVAEILRTLLPIIEGMNNVIDQLTEKQSPYFRKIVEMGMAKPINPIIFAPQVNQNISVNINSNNDIGDRNSNNTTINEDNRVSIDARKKNCDNIKMSKKEDNRVFTNNSKNNSDNTEITSFLRLIEDNSTNLKLNFVNQNYGNEYNSKFMFKSPSGILKLKE